MYVTFGIYTWKVHRNGPRDEIEQNIKKNDGFTIWKRNIFLGPSTHENSSS